MIDEIKKVVKNYIQNAKLTDMALGTVVSDGIRINTKTIVPNELVKGNLKNYISIGDKVRLIRNTGSQEFYIVEIIGVDTIIINRTLEIEPITIGNTTISNIKVRGVVK